MKLIEGEEDENMNVIIDDKCLFKEMSEYDFEDNFTKRQICRQIH
jgi:hypothetical protein